MMFKTRPGWMLAFCCIVLLVASIELAGSAKELLFEGAKCDPAPAASSFIGPILFALLADEDGDGVEEGVDNCPSTPNPGQEDTDDDDKGDVCDNCPYEANPDQADLDDDTLGDECDNCLMKYNPDQSDFDDDTLGDACDNCSLEYNPDQADQDADLVGNVCDNCPDKYNPDQVDLNENGVGDACEEADLSVQIFDEPDPISVGETLTWNVVVASEGPYAAADLLLAFTLPVGVTFRDAEGSGWGCSGAGGAATCTRFEMPAYETSEIRIYGFVEENAPVQLMALAQIFGSRPDPNQSNNFFTELTTLRKLADLKVTLQAPDARGRIGDIIPYEAFVENESGIPVPSVTFWGSLGDGAELLAIEHPDLTCTIFGKRAFTCELIRELRPGETLRAPIRAQSRLELIDTESDQFLGFVRIDLWVQVRSSAVLDPNPENNLTRKSLAHSHNADVSIKSIIASKDPAELASSYQYDILLSNAGPANAVSLTVTGSLIHSIDGVYSTSGNPNLSPSIDQSITQGNYQGLWNCTATRSFFRCVANSPIQDGSDVLLTLKIITPIDASAGGSTIHILARVDASNEEDKDKGNNVKTSSTQLAKTLGLMITRATVTNRTGGAPIWINDFMLYTVEIKNLSSKPLQAGLAVNIPSQSVLGDKVSFVQIADSPTWTCNASNVVSSVGSVNVFLGCKDSKMLKTSEITHIKFLLKSPASEQRVVAFIKTYPLSQPQSNLIHEVVVDALIVINREVDLSVDINISPTSPGTGPVTHFVRVENASSNIAYNVKLEFKLSQTVLSDGQGPYFGLPGDPVDQFTSFKTPPGWSCIQEKPRFIHNILVGHPTIICTVPTFAGGSVVTLESIFPGSSVFSFRTVSAKVATESKETRLSNNFRGLLYGTNPPGAADITLTGKISTRHSVGPNTTFNIPFEIRNNGTAPVSGLAIKFTLPEPNSDLYLRLDSFNYREDKTNPSDFWSCIALNSLGTQAQCNYVGTLGAGKVLSFESVMQSLQKNAVGLTFLAYAFV